MVYVSEPLRDLELLYMSDEHEDAPSEVLYLTGGEQYVLLRRLSDAGREV